MKRIPTNDPNDDFIVEITSLDTPETAKTAPNSFLQGSRLAPRVRTWLTILSIGAGLLLIFVVLSPILSALLAKKTSPPPTFHQPSAQIQNVNVQNNIAYVTSSDGTLRALNVKNGSLLWQHNAAEPVETVSGTGGPTGLEPLFLNDKIYIGYYNQKNYVIQALRANSGAVLWTFKASSNINPLIIDSGTAYTLFSFSLQSHIVTALDSKNGTRLWYYTLNNVPQAANIGIEGEQDKIYIFTYTNNQPQDTDFSVLRARDGSLLWHLKAANVQYMQDNLVSITTVNGTSKVLNADTGREIWHYQSSNGPSMIGENLFYIQTPQGAVQALNVDDGTLAWTYKTSWGIAQIFSEVDGVLYLETGDDFLVALRTSNGTQLWRTRPIAPPFTFSQIQVMNGIIYVFTLIGNEQYQTIMTLQANNGSLIWKRNIETSANNPGAQIINNQLLVDSGSTITVLRARDGAVLWHADYTPTTSTSQYNFGFLALSDNTVILRSSDSIMEAHQLQTGSVLWTYPRS